MRDAEVPQEGNITLAGHRKAVYALGAGGNIGIAPSCGWEAEEIVTRQAVDECVRLAIDAQERARQGAASPLEFHMYRGRMDTDLLSQTSGIWRWRIRRHFRPELFRQLSRTLLQRYADALGITVDVLQRID